jgi:hypothetical protein
MTSRQLNHQAMLECVANYLQMNREELHKNPAIAGITITLAEELRVMNELKMVQARKTTLESQAKDELRTALANDILKIGSALRAHAIEVCDTDLMAVTNFTDSKIRRMPDYDLAEKAKSIYKASVPHEGTLGIYMVKSGDVRNLKERIPHYLKALPVRRDIQKQNKEATTAIRESVNRGLKLVKEKLDVHMRPFKAVHESLYGDYLKARQIAGVKSTNRQKQVVREQGQTIPTGGPEAWSID